jgi:hypothetical protein
LAIGEVQRVVVYSIKGKAPNGAFFLTFEVSKDLEGFNFKKSPFIPLVRGSHPSWSSVIF